MDHIAKNRQQWLAFLDSEKPEEEIPNVIVSGQHNPIFEDLLRQHTIKVFRPDRFHISVRSFIERVLGEDFMRELPIDLSQIVKE